MGNIYEICLSVFVAFRWSYTGQLWILMITLTEKNYKAGSQDFKIVASIATLLLLQLIHNIISVFHFLILYSWSRKQKRGKKKDTVIEKLIIWCPGKGDQHPSEDEWKEHAADADVLSLLTCLLISSM